MEFEAKGQMPGEGAASFGGALGVFSVSGTVKGFGALSKSFTIGFTTAGWGRLSVGSAKIIASAGGVLGKIQVNATLAVPAAASLNQFEGANLEETSKGNCP